MNPLKLGKVILCSLLMGAEQIFRTIAFACPAWIRRLGPYVIQEVYTEVYTRNIQCILMHQLIGAISFMRLIRLISYGNR